VALRLPQAAQWSLADAGTFVILAAAVALCEWSPVRIRYRTETLNLSLSEAVWTAALILLSNGPNAAAGRGASILTLAVGVGVLAGQGSGGRAPIKLLFNLGQFVFAITIAEALFTALPTGAVTQPLTWGAAAVALGGFLAVNMVLTNLVIARVETRPLREVLGPSVGPVVLHWTGNVAVGLVAAVTWRAARGAMPLLVVPLVLAHLAYRGWLCNRSIPVS
jgi:hypothetical protein